MEKILFPIKIMGITQGMNGGYSHKGTHAIDLAWYNEENKKVYAPFTGKVAQIYPDNNGVWLQSVDKVLFADGTVDYATVKTIHSNDISNLYVGKVVKQGEHYYTMGKKGQATAVHLHIEIAKGHVKGFAKNQYGIYHLPNSINVYDGFCLGKDVVVKNGLNYAWKREDEVKEPQPTPTPSQKFEIGAEVIINGNLYKTANEEKATGSVSNKKTKITRYVANTKHPYNTTGDLGWMNESDIKLATSTETKYTVKAGDNLTSIAKKYNTTWQKIYNDNKSVIGSNPNIIKAGQVLTIK